MPPLPVEDDAIIDGDYVFQTTLPVSSAGCGTGSCYGIERSVAFPFDMEQLTCGVIN